MSFLNPVNEPVLRFSSTDAGAPQINYAARTAGDVKAVLKACLVTGYGAKASAGWSVVNEIDHVTEFVSPSAAMSDYRLGIDDTSASSTTWYYQYQDARVNPTDNALTKNFNYIDKASDQNGWELITTERGFYFVEFFITSETQAKQSRVTFFGQTKSAIVNASDNHNMGFWSVGHHAATVYSWQFFPPIAYTKRYYNINGYKKAEFASSNIAIMSNYPIQSELSVVDMIADLYLVQDGLMLARQPGLLLAPLKDLADRFGVYDTTVADRPVLYASLGVSRNDLESINGGTRGVMIRLDYWEY